MAEVTHIQDKRELKFVFAPDMDKLREKVDGLKDLYDEAQQMVEEIENADDISQRLIYLATAVRDFDRGLISAKELQDRCSMALTNADVENTYVELLVGPVRTIDGGRPTVQ